MSPYFLYVAAALVGVVATGRAVRLISQDVFPPSAWVRDRWVRLVRGHETWSLLIECPWCLAPYVAAANLTWALATDLQPAWWIVNGWLAAAYAASWLVIHDED